MFDSLFNLIIILIPLSIFIGRFAIQARNKDAPKPPPPRIPVHFEDDENEDERDDEFSPFALSRGADEYFKGLSQGAPAPKPSRKPRPSGKLAETLKPHGPGNLAASLATTEKAAAIGPSVSSAISKTSAASGSLPGQNDFLQKLNRLSPLKQAVVMAEILGPPKGIA